ncbi:hypothetical protein JYK02_16565 [Corallococcus macrosporus]|uniref:Uncharacterized protein n=1 Tax=Corallococcus macrosporus TaxID=35 RepID=A0ABS3DBV2_9BACT|nr:hypothetical protein [Corallococcus macrosporus]MBN8229123.1 hypothetical protein [Corallococcus macrosporus]
MKDAYIVLDYSALEQQMSNVMTSHLKGYVTAKARAAHGTKYFNAYRATEPVGFVCDMRQPIKALHDAIQFIKGRLSSIRTSQVKILIAGHGQFNENRGIVQGGASGTMLGVTNEHIADHVGRITSALQGQWIQWTLSLCVCFAARPKTGYAERITGDSDVGDSMAGQLARLLRKKLPDFTLKANFTPVSIGDSGHLKARLERSQLRKFSLSQAEARARDRYPRGYAFWSNLDSTEPMPLWSMCITSVYALKEGEVSDESVSSSEFQESFRQEFLMLAEGIASTEPEFAESLERNADALAEILNYRLVDLRVQAYEPGTLEKANKVVWTCTKGQLSHAITLREE